MTITEFWQNVAKFSTGELEATEETLKLFGTRIIHPQNPFARPTEELRTPFRTRYYVQERLTGPLTAQQVRTHLSLYVFESGELKICGIEFRVKVSQ